MGSNNKISRLKALTIIASVLLIVLLVVAVLLSLLSRRQSSPQLDASQPPGPHVVAPVAPDYLPETQTGSVPGDQTAPLPPDGTEDIIQLPPPTNPESAETKETNPADPKPPTKADPTEPPKATEPAVPTEPPAPTQPPKPTDQIDGGALVCKEYAVFSGAYVEDGRDELVQNVAAILVTNQSDRFLDLATLSYDIDGKTAAFLVTGLPPGKSAWVMEVTRMQVSHSSVFTYKDCITSFKSDVMLETDAFTVTADGNMLTATNTSGKTLSNVCVYYRTVHDDGNYFGGITYLTDFGTLAPGESVEALAGHYEEGSAEIIRYGWTDG